MGNDGGTIARRSDLVHTKQAAKTSLDIDPRLVARNTFASCALSRLPLRLPVVTDGLGNLYRKDKLVEFLLKKAELQLQLQLNNNDKVNEMAVAGHLRGLKVSQQRERERERETYHSAIRCARERGIQQEAIFISKMHMSIELSHVALT